MANIEIISYTSVKKDHLLGYVNIYIPSVDLEIYGFTLWQKNGKRWFNLPSVQNANDKEKYYHTIKFRNRETLKRFLHSLKVAFDLYCSKHGTASTVKGNPSVFE